MDYELELEVWLQAQRSMPHCAFVALVQEGVKSYRRMPGYSDLERVHPRDIGPSGLTALREALAEIGQLRPEDGHGFVSVRASLRAHICNVLRWQLLASSRASGAVVDSHFAHDLGL
jgi:hypothetical protein